MDEYKYYAGSARTIGVAVQFLTPPEVKEIWPLMETDGIIGAIQHLEDGYIQPADLTQALARGARNGGAEIYRNTTVTAITQKPNGEWLVTTDKGEITCEHVVSATGNFARKTGEMVGLDIPVIPVEHQYIVTEQHPLIMERRRQGLPEMGVLRESDSSWYMREEAGGLLLGPYEVGAPCCYVDGPSPQSEYELFQEDLDRLAPYIETAITAPSPIRPMAARSSGPPGICATSGSTRAIASASRRPAALAGSSPNGSSRASPRSI
jgi:dimethylglycine dehydrogenase